MALDGSYEGPKNRCQHIFPFMCNLPLSHVANGWSHSLSTPPLLPFGKFLNGHKASQLKIMAHCFSSLT